MSSHEAPYLPVPSGASLDDEKPFQPFLVIEFSKEQRPRAHRSSSLNPIQLVAPCEKHSKNQKTSKLLQLPAEIRCQIWNELLGDVCVHVMNCSSYFEGGWNDRRPFYKHHICSSPLEPWLRNRTGKQLLINGAYSTRDHLQHGRGKHVVKPQCVDLRVLRTCRQLYCEAGEILAGRTNFRIDRDRFGIRGVNNYSFWQICSPTIKQGLERIDVFHEWTWIWNDEHIQWLLQQNPIVESLQSVRFILREECNHSDDLSPHSISFMAKNFESLLAALHAHGLKSLRVSCHGEQSADREISCDALLADFDKEYVNGWSLDEANLVQALLAEKIKEIDQPLINSTLLSTKPPLYNVFSTQNSTVLCGSG